MRFTSIRARVTLLSVMFAMLLVASVTSATYILVARGMSHAADDMEFRLADVSERVMNAAVASAGQAADVSGLSGSDKADFVIERVVRGVPDSLARGLMYEGAVALYVRDHADSAERRAWCIGECSGASAAGRARAAETRTAVRETVGASPLIYGMLMTSHLGQRVTYIPVNIPGIHSAVLQVGYSPAEEEAILDTTRPPMIVVTVLSLIAAILITMLTTGWTLTLVNDLRRTADSVNVGRLDVQLPVQGDNEVAELARSLNRLIDRLRRRNEAQARFIADASHELATPVAGIRGYVNILRAWGAEDQALRDEAVGAIDRESRRMARLCSDLLSVIRNESLIEYRQLRYDINAVAREVLANAATRYIGKDLEFAGPDEGPMWLIGDPERIEEALSILADNACKYTPAGGEVSISTRRQRGLIVVDVTDTGVGIPESDLPNVFDRFYRSDLSRSKETGGFGLGLAIAKHIVDASGGSISVRSTVGHGTTFEVSLPKQRNRNA